ncbi:WD40 repeat domain-containing protein [Streptomyces alanosinicus]|uniref:WD40 repeat domain-containing protein n=1 Tax=Streptomyces alanosinicus TaxID=68171 RepID=UPI0016799148|nr:WD40 repeat domain-containing protein [Streptomyces alanosinicus]
MHFAGHGVQATSGGLFLATAGAENRDGLLVDTCVSVGQLLEEAENGEHPVLLLLDVCSAGQAIVQQQLAELTARRRQDTARRVWIIGACAADAVAYGARFTTAMAEVLHRLADGDLDVAPTLEHVPVETLAAAVDRRLARGGGAGRARSAVVRSTQPSATPEPPPFFPNPAHSAVSHVGALTGLDTRLREFALGCAPGLDPLHFATRAAGNPAADEILFTGRRSQLASIQAWLDDTSPESGRLLAVTGGPGSGKSALLGVTACLLHPDLEQRLGRRIGNAVITFDPRQPGIVLAVHARQLTTQQIVHAMGRQLQGQQGQQTAGPTGYDGGAGLVEPRPGTPLSTSDTADRADREELLRELYAAGDVLIILDALDEATDPADVTAELLLPLVRGNSGPRVLIGTRPWWDALPGLREHLAARPGSCLDLDPVTGTDRDVLAVDLDDYLRRLLPRRHPARRHCHEIARRLARYSDHGAFLVAALYANHLLTTSEAIPLRSPYTVTDVFDMHVAMLAANDPWVRPVLAAVGHAQGQGMPLDLIHVVATAHRPPEPEQPAPTLADTRRALAKASFYLRTTPDTDRRLLYRYFHNALTEHAGTDLRPATVHHALISAIPATADGTHNWAHAHPYLLRHAAGHASQAHDGALDRLLTDLDYLVHAEPDTLAPYLHHVTTEQAVLNADIYRSTIPHHPYRHDAAVRRDLLALDALGWKQPRIARALTDGADRATAPFTPCWATRVLHPAHRRTLTTRSHQVNAVAVVPGRDGNPLAVTIGADGSVMVWDLESGTARHALTGHTGRAFRVAATIGLDGTPLGVTTADEAVIVWDLETGTARRTLTGHTGRAHHLAATTGADGTPLAAAMDSSGCVFVWDLETGAARHTLPLTGHKNGVTGVAVTPGADGTLLAVTSDMSGRVIVWDLTSGTVRHTLPGHDDMAAGVAAVPGAGTPLAVTFSWNGLLIVWDLETGAARHTLPLTGHTDQVTHVAAMAGADGTLLAVTADMNGLVIVWDPVSGSARHTLTGHTTMVSTVAIAIGPGGTTLAVTGDHDGLLAVWDVDARTARHPLNGHTGEVQNIAVTTGPDDSRIAVTTGLDGLVIVWDIDSGTPRHILTGHLDAVYTVTALSGVDGSVLAVTSDTQWCVIVWDLRSGAARHTLREVGGTVPQVALAAEGTTPLAVIVRNNHHVSLWDLNSGTARHTLTTDVGWVSATAITTGTEGTLLAVLAGSDTTVHGGLGGPFDDPRAGGRATVIVWDLDSGGVRHTLTSDTSPIRALHTTSDANGTPRAVTVDDDGTVIAWDLEAGTVRHTLTGHTGRTSGFTVTSAPDGTPLVVTVDKNGTVVIWDPDCGAVHHTLTSRAARSGLVTTVSVKGRLMAVAVETGRTVVVWDLYDGDERFRYHLPYKVTRIRSTGTGFVVAYGPEVAYFAPTGDLA